jgi:hypothetical protein
MHRITARTHKHSTRIDSTSIIFVLKARFPSIGGWGSRPSRRDNEHSDAHAVADKSHTSTAIRPTHKFAAVN